MTAKISLSEDLEIIARPTTIDGQPAKLDEDTFTVASDNEDVIGLLKVEEGDDETGHFYRAVLESRGAGHVTLTVSGDADLGEGVETISELIDVIVGSAHASNLGLVVRGIPKANPPA